ncbi:hypothetical protein C8R46DRAFT_1034137 [Mycena filopes]|nr:hypothetical protein C8R46DRAFT_1034137 [Mycena filopes]
MQDEVSEVRERADQEKDEKVQRIPARTPSTHSAQFSLETQFGFRDVEPHAEDRATILKLQMTRIVYIVSEEAANQELAHIVDGVVGFDTEFGKRTPSPTEKLILDMEAPSASAKKAAKAIFQYLELLSASGYQINWDRAGLCTIQIARDSATWVLNMRRIKGFPRELRRILQSPKISLAGAGLLSDVTVIWEDLRVDMKQLTDVGLMTRIWNTEAHADEGFQHLALESAAKEALDLAIDKSKQNTIDWKKEPSDRDITCEVQHRIPAPELTSHTDAAVDAAVSLRLFEFLAPALAAKEKIIDHKIPPSWYTYNTTEGEPTRVERSYRGAVIPWTLKDTTWWVSNKFQGYLP